MNSRVVTIVVGIIILAMGLAGLIYPGRIMGLLGFAIFNASESAAALGEVRATYGGIFIVMGIYAILSANDPVAHRGRLLLIGLLWLGACAGRIFGVFADGNPGLFGWLAALFELVIGGALVFASQSAPPAAAPVATAGAPSYQTTP